MSEPPEELPPELRELVGDLRRDALEPERVARVAERLGPILGPSGGGGGGGPSGSAGAGRLATLGKIAASALVLGSVAALTLLPHARRPPATERPAVAVAPPEQLGATAAPIPAAPSQAGVPAEPVPTPLEPAPHHSARATPRPAATTSEHAGGDDLAAEEALLLRAREALASSPRTALALADEHAKRFPRGTLVQEREVLAIDALGRMGRTEEASGRAHRFQTRWPTSPYVRELRDRGLIE